MDLKVVDISVRNGKGSVVLVDRAHDRPTAAAVTLEFPLGQEPPGGFDEREEVISRDAQALLAAAREALKER
jgi:hypothetical protein